MSIINDTRKFKQYPDVLSADQAAEILDVSKKTSYQKQGYSRRKGRSGI